MVRRLMIVSIATVGALVIFCALEFSARLFLVRFDPYVDRSIPYKGSDYYSQQFVQEEVDLALSAYLGDDAYWHIDFHGRWINVDHDIRRTTNQPASALHTIWLFGSSTTFNAEVPDEYTIASYLQRLIGNSYRVVNLGQTGFSVSQELDRLKHTTIRPGDMVIFYDGMTDIDLLPSLATRREWTITGRFCKWLPPQLAMTDLYCRATDVLLPEMTITPQAIDGLHKRYRTALRDANQYALARGATFWHFIQPHIWSKSPSEYERHLMDDLRVIPARLNEAVSAGWPVLQTVQADLGLPGADLTYALDALRSSGVEVYLDYDHTTERGNEAVAQAIYDQLSIY